MKITKFKVNDQDAPVGETALDGKLLPVPQEGDTGKVPTVNESNQYELRMPEGPGYSVVTTTREAAVLDIEVDPSSVSETFEGSGAYQVVPDEQRPYTISQLPEFVWVKVDTADSVRLDEHVTLLDGVTELYGVSEIPDTLDAATLFADNPAVVSIIPHEFEGEPDGYLYCDRVYLPSSDVSNLHVTGVFVEQSIEVSDNFRQAVLQCIGPGPGPITL